MLASERQSLASAISAYEHAKESGDAEELKRRSEGEPGLTLIVARIAKGFTQRDLAWRLGVKEQQVQRYEADRYQSVSLKNYSRIASLLGVQLQASIITGSSFRGLEDLIADASKESIKKILLHGRKNRWFGDEMDEAQLRQTIAENRIEFGSPSLLRTGLNVVDHSEDVLLHAWRARVAIRARSVIDRGITKFDLLNIGWLHKLLAASASEDGPSLARQILFDNGIILIVEPQISGLFIDGAAFLLSTIPVIGLTIRKDSVDNFWFTLMHELGHVLLHYRTGLSTGFYDQIETKSTDEQESEADLFAENILISEERWRRSKARIANSEEIIEKFAAELGISPAIVFGRIRKERKNYKAYSNKIGMGLVRHHFVDRE